MTEFRDEIYKSFEKFQTDLTKYLTANAYSAHAYGDLSAVKELGLKMDFKLIDAEAIKFSENYGRELIKTGSSWIRGIPNKISSGKLIQSGDPFKWQKIPWLKDYTLSQRKQIIDIINSGLKSGKPLGVKEYLKGGYPKNTIASDLSKIFKAQKSHASLVARTEFKRISKYGKLNRFAQQGIENVRWICAEPCVLCQPYCGKEYPLNAIPYDGLVHPNCMCVQTPVVKKISEIKPLEFSEPISPYHK